MKKNFIHVLFIIYFFSIEKSFASSQGKILLKVENEIISDLDLVFSVSLEIVWKQNLKLLDNFLNKSSMYSMLIFFENSM